MLDTTVQIVQKYQLKLVQNKDLEPVPFFYKCQAEVQNELLAMETPYDDHVEVAHVFHQIGQARKVIGEADILDIDKVVPHDARPVSVE